MISNKFSVISILKLTYFTVTYNYGFHLNRVVSLLCPGLEVRHREVGRDRIERPQNTSLRGEERRKEVKDPFKVTAQIEEQEPEKPQVEVNIHMKYRFPEFRF